MKNLYLLFILTFIYTHISAQTITVEEKCTDVATVTVNVDIADFTNIKGFQFFINYDNTVINNPVIGNKATLPSGIEQDNITSTQVRYLWAAFPSVAHTIADITVFTITFDVIGSNGDLSALTISNHNITDASNMSVTPTTDDGEVTVATSCTLPVELVFFNANIQHQVIQLNWQTAAELNNSHFEIERSLDGKNWEMIGTKKGNGTTNTAQNYTYFDEIPQNGVNYYRLKQVDFNDEYEYSEVKSIEFFTEQTSISCYPNPTKDYVYFNNFTEGSISIWNVLGQQVASYKIDGVEHINIQQLEKGQYFIRVMSKSNELLHSQKIIKN